MSSKKERRNIRIASESAAKDLEISRLKAQLDARSATGESKSQDDDVVNHDVPSPPQTDASSEENVVSGTPPKTASELQALLEAASEQKEVEEVDADDRQSETRIVSSSLQKDRQAKYVTPPREPDEDELSMVSSVTESGEFNVDHLDFANLVLVAKTYSTGCLHGVYDIEKYMSKNNPTCAKILRAYCEIGHSFDHGKLPNGHSSTTTISELKFFSALCLKPRAPVVVLPLRL